MVKREKEEELKSRKQNLILSLTINTNVRPIETPVKSFLEKTEKKNKEDLAL